MLSFCLYESYECSLSTGVSQLFKAGFDSIQCFHLYQVHFCRMLLESKTVACSVCQRLLVLLSSVGSVLNNLL